MKRLLMLPYIILVAVGALFIHFRGPRAFEYAAERDLPENHRLLPGDLRSPDITWVLAPGLPDKSNYAGQYLDRHIASGQALKREYLRDHPVVVAARDTETYAWLLRDSEKQWAQVIDAGWVLDLCADDCPLVGAPVLAVDCMRSSAVVCAVVFQVTRQQKALLLTYQGKQRLNIVVSNVDLGGTK